jgi:hypothetical protein
MAQIKQAAKTAINFAEYIAMGVYIFDRKLAGASPAGIQRTSPAKKLRRMPTLHQKIVWRINKLQHPGGISAA